MRFFRLLALLTIHALIVHTTTNESQAAIFASSVVSYDPGSTPAPGYTHPAAALETPNGLAGQATIFQNVLSAFSPPFGLDEIVSIGAGGHLTLQFPTTIEIGPGADVGVFTNAGLIDVNLFNGQAGTPANTFGSDTATIEVSSEGQQWVSLGETTFNIPSNFYPDAGPYDADPGSQLADFGQPFTPAGGLSAFDGLGYTRIVSLLDGAGGGTWLDLSPTGLSEVGFVRFSVAFGNFELDAVSIANGKASTTTPEPSTLGILGMGLVLIRCHGQRKKKTL